MSWQVRQFPSPHDPDDMIWRLEHVQDGRNELPGLDLFITGALGLSANDGPVAITLVPPPGPPAARASISVKPTPKEEPIVAVQLNVDTTAGSESIALDYDDDHGNPTSAPAGASVTFSSSDPSVVRVGDVVPTEHGFRAPLTVGNVGSYQITVTQSSANKADGTPIPDPAPLTGSVTPGPAATNILSEEDTPGAPPSSAPPAGAATSGATAPATSGATTPAAASPQAEQPAVTTSPSGAAGAAGGTPGVDTGQGPLPAGQTPVAPAAATPATPTTTTASGSPAGQPVYTYAGAGTPDTQFWQPAGTTADGTGRPVYRFVNDSPGQPATGASTEWVEYTGPVA